MAGLGGRAHAVTIDVLGGCVNNAISLFKALVMSDDQHNVTDSNEQSSESMGQAATSDQEANNPFVPEVAKVELEEVYVDIEESAGGPIFKIPAVGWFVLCGVLFCVAAIFLLSVFKSPSLEEEAIEVQQIILENEKEERKLEAHEFSRRLLKQASACIRDYYSASQISEKLKYVRHPQRVRALMEEYYKQHSIVTDEFHQFEKYGALEIEKVPFVYARVQMKSGVSKDVLLEQMADESFKLDWETEVHYQPISWDAFIRQRPSKPHVMRVAVKPDSFYVYGFRDSSKYDCYQLTAMNSDRYVFGYVVKGSELSIQLRQFFMRVKNLSKISPEPMMLELRFPEASAQGDCVHIDRLVAPRWFLAREPEGGMSSSESKAEE